MNRRRSRSGSRGFTLVELSVVMVITGVVAIAILQWSLDGRAAMRAQVATTRWGEEAVGLFRRLAAEARAAEKVDAAAEVVTLTTAGHAVVWGRAPGDVLVRTDGTEKVVVADQVSRFEVGRTGARLDVRIGRAGAWETRRAAETYATVIELPRIEVVP